ncbi:MAG: radical SAM family heme chaperone HemW [Pseudomonadota bacterium]
MSATAGMSLRGHHETIPPHDLALYIHWPFCATKCPYCDFNSHVRDTIDVAEWTQALLTALRSQAAEVPHHRLHSIFFGGGTPSLMPPAMVAALIEEAKRLWPHQDSPLEITLEANPSSVEIARFEALREAGVNRISIGVQSLDDDHLKFLGRPHNAAEARAAIEAAGRIFANWSLDLIYALPGDTVATWRQRLDDVIPLLGNHASLYQLTIEPGTAFYSQHKRGAFTLPDEETAADLFRFTQDRMAEAGLPSYEISNHARPGAQSKHNLVYWRGSDYLGVGPGAHGRIENHAPPYGRQARVAVKKPEAYLRHVAEHGHDLQEVNWIDPKAATEELVMMALRIIEGIDLTVLQRLSRRQVSDTLDEETIDLLCDEGLITCEQNRLALTGKGRPLLNTIAAKLLKA